MIEIMPIGGYREVGKNCTAVKVDDEVIILDMGLHMQNYIEYTDQEAEELDLSTQKLVEIKAVPDITMLGEWKNKVKAICISHGHLDHVGAAPFMVSHFNCPVHGTPYTIEILKALIEGHELHVKNPLISHDVNSTFKISENIKVEFIHITHSILQCVVVAIHTKYGILLYANDFKLDNTPVLGPKTNFSRLGQLKNVKYLIMDSLYANKPVKTPSEAVAREMLREVLMGTNTKGKAIIVSTFSSHMSRIHSILEFSRQLKRKVVFLGRSLEKYVHAAERAKLVDYSKNVRILKFDREIKNFLKNCKSPEQYVFVVTGHQGEPKSVLARMIFKGYFKFRPDDIVVYSCTIIPAPENIVNREKMEAELKKKKVRIFRDIHVSGHGAREDARDLIQLIKPANLIPAHSEINVMEEFLELAEELGYKENKNVFLMKNGTKLKLGQ